MIVFISILIIISILSTRVSSKLGLPLLIGFIFIGIIAGSDVLNLIYFDNAYVAKQISEFLLIFIIFDGGFRITKDEFRSVAGPSLTLATLGVILTAAVIGIFIHLVLKFDIIYSLLIASIISSTDAAGVFMITKANPIKNKVASTLNVESSANDPMAILLTMTFIQIASNSFKNIFYAIISLIWQFCGGIAIGFICYVIIKNMFVKLKFDTRGNYNVLIIGCVLLAYGVADLFKANGIIALFFTGYWLGNTKYPAKQSVSGFLESLSTLFNIAIFIILGLLSFPHRFVNIWKESILIVLVMMFAARPIAVFLSLLPFKYTVKEKLFIMWGGIKGAVPIVLATYPLAFGLDKTGFIFDTIFFAVLLSCIVQGTTLGALSKLFKLTEKKKLESPHLIELHSLETTDIEMIEIHLSKNSSKINYKISELNLDKDVSITSIIRDGKIVLPKGNTILKEGDILYMLVHVSKIQDVNLLLN